MPFREIKPKKDFIHIHKNRITISSSLISYFEKVGSNFATSKGQTLFKVRVFYDEKKGLIGLKPDENGYKIYIGNNCYQFVCAELGRLAQGDFYPKWSEKEGMLIFKVKEGEIFISQFNNKC